MFTVQTFKYEHRQNAYTLPCTNYDDNATLSQFVTAKKRYEQEYGSYEYTLLKDDKYYDRFYSNQALIF